MPHSSSHNDWQRFWDQTGDNWDSLWNWVFGNGWQTSARTNQQPIEEQGPVAQWFNSNGESTGEALNNITGTTASQQWQSHEAAVQRDWETADRIATQEYNSAEAQKAREWQQHMDSTAVQRRMEDLAAAGLNPMAMVSGGSFMSGGSSGSTAASVSPGSGAAAGGSGNSAAAVGSAMRSVSTIVSSIIKALA